MYSACVLVDGCKVGITPIKMLDVVGVGVGVGVGRWKCLEIDNRDGNVSMYGAVESVDVFTRKVVPGGNNMHGMICYRTRFPVQAVLMRFACQAEGSQAEGSLVVRARRAEGSPAKHSISHSQFCSWIPPVLVSVWWWWVKGEAGEVVVVG
jgi:hypothetical protein